MKYRVTAVAVHIKGIRYKHGTILPDEITEDVKNLTSVESIDDGQLSGKSTGKSTRKGVQREAIVGDAE